MGQKTSMTMKSTLITEIFRQLKYISTITKPKHIYNAMKDPHHTIKVLKYHYRRVSEKAFVEFFAEQWGCSSEEIQTAYRDLTGNIKCWEEISESLSNYKNSYALQMPQQELSVLYILTRLLKPECIVETGVSAGVSSAYILRALEDNQKGKLYSIDLPPDNILSGKTSGWIVPQYLRNRWSLHIGDSKEVLKPLLDSVGEIDCFIHDSLHTYDHMISEFRTAWKHLRSGGLLLSHDIGGNEAFFDFMQEKVISWKSYRVLHLLGGFLKE
jgi:predicted O-methyltransferase YrrM